MSVFTRFGSRSELARRYNPDVSTEEALARSIAVENVEEQLQEVREIKKRKRPAEEETVRDIDVVLPPVMARSERASNGGLKPAGVVFCATYDDALTLGKTLCKLDKFKTSYKILFNRDGMQISFLDRSQVLMVKVVVAPESFARYVNLGARAIEFVVTSKTVKRFGDLCERDHTFTLMYDQCSLEDEPLHMMLYPADGTLTSGQVIRLSVPPLKLDEPIVEPTEMYQYQIRVPSKLFWKNVTALAKESTTIVLMLSGDAFEMAALASDNQHTLSMHIYMKKDATELDESSCIIERVGDPHSHVTMAQLRNYRMSAVFLEGAASFGNVPHCTEVVLRMGASLRDDESGVYDEAPLHLRFPLRAGTKAPFDVEVWIAAKINEQ